MIFNGVTCCHLDGFGLLNIVYSLRLTEPSDKDYSRVVAQLNKGERLADRRGATMAYMYSSLGAELAIEFDSLKMDRRALDVGDHCSVRSMRREIAEAVRPRPPVDGRAAHTTRVWTVPATWPGSRPRPPAPRDRALRA